MRREGGHVRQQPGELAPLAGAQRGVHPYTKLSWLSLPSAKRSRSSPMAWSRSASDARTSGQPPGPEVLP
jgi:hypothetical protein